MVTLRVLFTGFFVASLLRMTAYIRAALPGQQECLPFGDFCGQRGVPLGTGSENFPLRQKGIIPRIADIFFFYNGNDQIKGIMQLGKYLLQR